MAAMTFFHEANNLMTPLTGYAEAALKSGEPGLMKKALEVAQTHSRMVVAMSERILQLGAARRSKPAPTNLRACIDDARAGLCRDLAKDGIRFECRVDESLTVCIDSYHLRQVFFNLMLNAREAMKDLRDGRLQVEAECNDREVIVRVSDSGKGIDPALLPNLFAPLQSTRSNDDSTPPRCGGLGLALCRDLVEEAGGSIGATSAPGRGTTITLTLPPAQPAIS